MWVCGRYAFDKIFMFSGDHEEALSVCCSTIKEAEPLIKSSLCIKNMFNEMQVERVLLLLIVQPVPSQVG